jgi:hypothetical protein
MIDKNIYFDIHRQPLTPLDIKVDVTQLCNDMNEYRYAFRRWGLKHLKYPRFGAPLVNENGEMFNNPEPVCFPLDQWYEMMGDKDTYEDTYYTEPTELLDAKCFDPLNHIKSYMVRSCILKWNDTGHFKPHIDTGIPTNTIRLWGTNDPENMILRFDKNNKRSNSIHFSDFDLTPFENIEAGRLYIIDTNIIHDAAATGDNVYQFFIALRADAFDLLKELIIV